MTRPLVALTGATGFVGKATLAALDRAGYAVRALARKVPTEWGVAEWVQGDLADRAALARLVDGAEAVVHVAGLTTAREPEEFEKALRIPFASEDLSSWALREFGVDPQLLHRRHGVRSRVMRRTCTFCQAKGRCRQDLMAGNFERNHKDYCPNRLHFAVLLARRAYLSVKPVRN